MASVTMFGKGNMGTAIAQLFETAGYDVQVLDSSASAQTQVSGDIVVLAVPYPAMSAIAKQFGDQLKGRTVVDIANPVDFSTMEPLFPAGDSSSAKELAKMIPDATVLKAFNTNFADSLTSKKVGENKTTVLIAGDDKEAKQQLSQVVEKAGLNSLDVGPLKRAHELESFGFLQLSMGMAGTFSFAGGFAVIQ